MTRFFPYLITVYLLSIALPAQAELVLVAGAKSPIGKLSKQQVIDIYLLKLKEFPGGGDIEPLMIESGPSRDDFLSSVLGKSNAQMKALWARLIFTGKGQAPTPVASPAEVKKLVAVDPNRVGYIDRAEVDSSVKILFSP